MTDSLYTFRVQGQEIIHGKLSDQYTGREYSCDMRSKAEIGKRLRAAREGQKLTLKELAAKTRSLSPSRISNYEQGTRSPGRDEATELGRALGLSAAYILGVGETPARYSAPPVRQIAIVGTTQGGPDKGHLELGYALGHGDQFIEMAAGDENTYALTVKGSSMAPRIREGDAIWVEPSHQVEPGDTVVARFLSGEVMVKELVSRRNGYITLDSIAKDEDRIVRPEAEVEFLHYVGGVVFPGKIKQRV